MPLVGIPQIVLPLTCISHGRHDKDEQNCCCDCEFDNDCDRCEPKDPYENCHDGEDGGCGKFNDDKLAAVPSTVWSLGPNPTRIATKMTLSLSSEPQACSLYRPRITQKEINPHASEGNECLYTYDCERWEVKCLGLHVMGHAPTVRSTTQAMSYIRAPEWVA